MKRFAAYTLALVILASLNICGLYCAFFMDASGEEKIAEQMPSCHSAKKSKAHAVPERVASASLKTPVPCLEKNVVTGIFTTLISFKPIVIISDRSMEFSFLWEKHASVAMIEDFTPHLYSKLPLYLSKQVIRI